MRRIVHLPAGTSQLRLPSLAIFEVRLSTSARPTAAEEGTAGVGTDSYSNRKLKPAFSSQRCTRPPECSTASASTYSLAGCAGAPLITAAGARRSEEHTSELQSLRHLVCRLLLEK